MDFGVLQLVRIVPENMPRKDKTHNTYGTGGELYQGLLGRRLEQGGMLCWTFRVVVDLEKSQLAKTIVRLSDAHDLLFVARGCSTISGNRRER